MNSVNVFIKEPLYFLNEIQIKIPTIREMVGVKNYNHYYSIFTISQEDIWDDIAKKNGKDPDGKPILDAPTPFEFLLINCYKSPQFKQITQEAFKFWTGEDVKIIPETKVILFTNQLNLGKQPKDIIFLNEDNYFAFQNLIRVASGNAEIEPPKYNEDPRVSLIKAKARYREKIKKEKGNKNSISLYQMIVAICCMNVGLNPLNIGEIPYPAAVELFSMAQLKEKYETDISIATAGFGNSKIKPKYWIQEKK